MTADLRQFYLNLRQCLPHIGDQICGLFDADAEAHQFIANAQGESFFFRQF